MFSNNTKLVWWNGTKFDGSYTDKVRAKIDNQLQSWYFTDKTDITVRFISDFDSNRTVTGRSVGYGNSVTQPADPQSAGAILSGWYLKWEDVPFDFSTPITRYTELYAKWRCDDGYAMNSDWTSCGSGVVVHFDTDGWTQMDDVYVVSWSALLGELTKFLHTINVDDDWNQINGMSYPSYSTLIDSATIPWSPNLHVKITYQTYYSYSN